jgi:hypothetical protein
MSASTQQPVKDKGKQNPQRKAKAPPKPKESPQAPAVAAGKNVAVPAAVTLVTVNEKNVHEVLASQRRSLHDFSLKTLRENNRKAAWLVDVFGSKRTRPIAQKFGFSVNQCDSAWITNQDVTRRDEGEGLPLCQGDVFLINDVYDLPGENQGLTPEFLVKVACSVTDGAGLVILKDFRADCGYEGHTAFWYHREDKVVYHPDALNAPYVHSEVTWLFDRSVIQFEIEGKKRWLAWSMVKRIDDTCAFYVKISQTELLPSAAIPIQERVKTVEDQILDPELVSLIEKEMSGRSGMSSMTRAQVTQRWRSGMLSQKKTRLLTVLEHLATVDSAQYPRIPRAAEVEESSVVDAFLRYRGTLEARPVLDPTPPAKSSFWSVVVEELFRWVTLGLGGLIIAFAEIFIEKRRHRIGLYRAFIRRRTPFLHHVILSGIALALWVILLFAVGNPFTYYCGLRPGSDTFLVYMTVPCWLPYSTNRVSWGWTLLKAGILVSCWTVGLILTTIYHYTFNYFHDKPMNLLKLYYDHLLAIQLGLEEWKSLDQEYSVLHVSKIYESRIPRIRDPVCYPVDPEFACQLEKETNQSYWYSFIRFSVLMVAFQNCSQTLGVVNQYRIQRAVPPVLFPARWTNPWYIPLNDPIHWEDWFASWLDNFSGVKKKRYIRLLEKATPEEIMQMWPKFVRFIKVFVKSDEMLFKTKCRPIFSVDPGLQVIQGPYVRAMVAHLKSVCPLSLAPVIGGNRRPGSVRYGFGFLQAYLWYLAAHSPRDLTQWRLDIMEQEGWHCGVAGDDVILVLSLGGTLVRSFSLDISACDQSLRSAALRSLKRPYERLGLPIGAFEHFWQIGRADLLIGNKRVKRPDMSRSTGEAATSLGNSLASGIGVGKALSMIDTSTNLLESLTEYLLGMGLQITGQEFQMGEFDALTNGADFLKGYWCPCQDGSVQFTVLPSRILKMGCCKKDPRTIYGNGLDPESGLREAALDHLAAVAQGLRYFPSCPLLEMWILKFARRDVGVNLEHLPYLLSLQMTDSKPCDARADELAWYEFMEKRYGLESLDVATMVSQIAALYLERLPIFISGPGWEKLVQVDYR